MKGNISDLKNIDYFGSEKAAPHKQFSLPIGIYLFQPIYFKI